MVGFVEFISERFKYSCLDKERNNIVSKGFECTHSYDWTRSGLGLLKAIIGVAMLQALLELEPD